MDIDDDDDDFYAPDEPQASAQPVPTEAPPAPTTTKKEPSEELESGEEEDEGGAMDEDEDSVCFFVGMGGNTLRAIADSPRTSTSSQSAKTARNPPLLRKSLLPQPLTPSHSRLTPKGNPVIAKSKYPQRSTASDTTARVKPATAPKRQHSDAHPPHNSLPEFPPVSMSKVDVHAIPIHKPTGKPLTAVNIDEDLPENDKPWRKPGTDLSDYFNYGFDEFTWALYAQKQEALRGEYNADVIAQNNKKMMEDMANMMMMGGMGPMPGMPGAPPGATGPAGAGAGAAGGGAGGAAGQGMEGVSPEMQAMMQSMMAQGMDPSQMDMGSMAAMFGRWWRARRWCWAARRARAGFLWVGLGRAAGAVWGYEQQMGGGGGGRGGRGGEEVVDVGNVGCCNDTLRMRMDDPSQRFAGI
ncbi:cleavage polyadenylation factor subunit fip1 [Collariella sp. IMI 366227]|nr:cleavage polyadenylation factor subunit fip1 [Collariella sp. IMI 366227]